MRVILSFSQYGLYSSHEIGTGSIFINIVWISLRDVILGGENLGGDRTRSFLHSLCWGRTLLFWDDALTGEQKNKSSVL
jgi:hypothetical protein